MFHILQVLKALADRNRLRIVMALMQYDELCACQITELLDVRGATASRHLSLLQHAGVLDARKEGRWIYYRLAPAETKNALLEWVSEGCIEEGLFQLDARKLKEIVKLGREELCRRQRGYSCCPE